MESLEQQREALDTEKMPRSDNLAIKMLFEMFSHTEIPFRLSNDLTKCDFSITLSFALFVIFHAVEKLKNLLDCSQMTQCMEKVFIYFNILFSCSIAAYSTNSLTTVAVGKSSLDSHSHFRQPGKNAPQ